jgi:hypothetical protein
LEVTQGIKMNEAHRPLKPMSLVESLRMEAACAIEAAESSLGSGQWRDGMAIIGRKMAAAADEIERLRAERDLLLQRCKALAVLHYGPRPADETSGGTASNKA